MHAPPGLVLCEADPAPLIAALLTGDMVAAGPLEGRNLAVGAWFYVVFTSEAIELFVADVSTAYIAMRSSPAAHTDFLSAGTGGSSRKHVGLTDIVVATVARAPAQVGVHVDLNVQLKPDVLVENYLGAELLDVAFSELDWTTMLHAG